jgi:hypothetical protein
VLYHVRINDTHVVAVHLPYSKKGGVCQPQSVQDTLTIRQDCRSLAQIDAQI